MIRENSFGTNNGNEEHQVSNCIVNEFILFIGGNLVSEGCILLSHGY